MSGQSPLAKRHARQQPDLPDSVDAGHRIPVWYAYMGEPGNGETPWYWISALKALEVGVFKKNGQGVEFLSLDLRHFEKIVSAADLGKLYTHRLPSLGNLSRAR